MQNKQSKRTRAGKVILKVLLMYLVSFIFILLVKGSIMLASFLTNGAVESVSMDFVTFFIMWTTLTFLFTLLDDNKWG